MRKIFLFLLVLIFIPVLRAETLVNETGAELTPNATVWIGSTLTSNDLQSGVRWLKTTGYISSFNISNTVGEQTTINWTVFLGSPGVTNIRYGLGNRQGNLSNSTNQTFLYWNNPILSINHTDGSTQDIATINTPTANITMIFIINTDVLTIKVYNQTAGNLLYNVTESVAAFTNKSLYLNSNTDGSQNNRFRLITIVNESYTSSSAVSMVSSSISPNSTVVPTSPLLQGFCNASSTNATANLSYYYRWFINDTLKTTGGSPPIFYNNGFAINTVNWDTSTRGMKILVGAQPIYLYAVEKKNAISGSEATVARLRATSTGADIATATFDALSNYATFSTPQLLNAGTNYYIMTDDAGANYNNYLTTGVTYPVSSTYFDWVAGAITTDLTGFAFNVQSISVSPEYLRYSLQGIPQNVNNFSVTSQGNYSLECKAYDIITGANSSALNSSLINISYGPASFSNNITNSTSTFPQYNETLAINVTVQDYDLISWCSLEVNDTGTWLNWSNLSAINQNNYIAQYVYNTSIKGNSTNNIGFYKVLCVDEFGNYSESAAFSYHVKDISAPTISLGSGNSFNALNTTVISPLAYDLNLNLTYYDANLFNVNVSVYCDINGTLFSYEILDIDTPTFNVSATIDLNGSLPIQRCVVSTYASDDHTKKRIKDYPYEVATHSIAYVPEENLLVNITGDDDETEIDEIKTNKEDDRYEIKYKFKHNKQHRVFVLKSSHKIYYQEDSGYNAHFVIWDEETGTGNWIDFNEPDLLPEHYTIEKVNNKKYKIIIDTPFNKKNFNFRSIGGLNIVNASYEFLIGSQLNISSQNLYDNDTIKNASIFMVPLSTYYSMPLIAKEFNSTTTIYNMSNGTYDILFYTLDNKFFNKSVGVEILNISHAKNYTSYQGLLYVSARNVVNLNYIPNLNITINQTSYGSTGYFKISFPTDNTTINTFYLNATNYSLDINTVGLTRYQQNFSMDFGETKTIDVLLSLSGTFNLFNESNGFPFGVYYNQTHALNNLSLQILCPAVTYVYYVPANTNSFTLPLNCSYSKLAFFQDYPGQHYYRFLILTPDSGFNIPVYLLDFWQGGTYATPSVKITFMFEDLLSKYLNPVMYIEAIKNGTVQITADYINATSSATVYLQQNGVYNIKLVSSNQPTYVIGEYVATDSETRVIRLYDINLNFTSEGYTNNVEWGWGNELVNTSYTNASYQDLYGFLYYNDSEFLTNNITLYLWKNNYNGTLITPEYTIISNSVYYTLNISDQVNNTVYGEIITWRNGTRYRYAGIVYVNERNVPEAFQYISQTFLDWFFMIFFSMIALSATIASGNFIALLIAGLALLFKAFGWITISRFVIGIALLISLIMFLRKSNKETD